MKALLIIDMQQGSFTTATPRYNTIGVVQRINQLAALFRRQGDAMIFIQHDGTANGDFVPGTAEWALLPALEQGTSAVYISKTANDCFYRSGLEAFLSANNIKELVMTGCATDFCVDTTLKAALSKDYLITIIADGHTTADRPSLTAAQVIDHYNWVWKNMLPTAGGVKVQDLAGYLS